MGIYERANRLVKWRITTVNSYGVTCSRFSVLLRVCMEGLATLPRCRHAHCCVKTNNTWRIFSCPENRLARIEKQSHCTKHSLGSLQIHRGLLRKAAAPRVQAMVPFKDSQREVICMRRLSSN